MSACSKSGNAPDKPINFTACKSLAESSAVGNAVCWLELFLKIVAVQIYYLKFIAVIN